MAVTPLTPEQIGQRTVVQRVKRVAIETQQKLAQTYMGHGVQDPASKTQAEARQSMIDSGRATVVAALGDSGEAVLTAYEKAQADLIAALS